MYLYSIAGEQKQSSDNVPDENENCLSPIPARALFVFTLRSFPALDKYRTSKKETVPYMVHNTVEKRVNALLAER